MMEEGDIYLRDKYLPTKNISALKCVKLDSVNLPYFYSLPPFYALPVSLWRETQT